MPQCRHCGRSKVRQYTACGIGFCSRLCQDTAHPAEQCGACLLIPTQPYEFQADFWDHWEYRTEPLGRGAYSSVIKVRHLQKPEQIRALKLIGPRPPAHRFREELDMSCKLKKHNPDLMTYEAVIWIPMPEGIGLPLGVFEEHSHSSSSSKSKSRPNSSNNDVLEIPIMGKNSGGADSSEESSEEVLFSGIEPADYSRAHSNDQRTYALVTELVDSGDLDAYVRRRFDDYYNQIVKENAENGIKDDEERDGLEMLARYADERLTPGGQRFILGAIISLARQLACIHEAGYEHRDIKPDNILFDSRTGRFRIIDFGLSSKVGKRPGYSGTTGYIAPELNRPANQRGDLRAADIWALGATLAYLYVGREFLDFDELVDHASPVNYEVIQRGIERVFDSFNPDIAAEKVLLGMLELHPEHRWSLHKIVDAATQALTVPWSIGARGGGRAGFRGNLAPRTRFFPSPRRLYYQPRPYYRPRRSWWSSGIVRPLWYASLLPFWYANALVYNDPAYHTYPITVDYTNELALRAELNRLRAENAALSRGNEYALVPDLEKGRYIWVRNPGY
jgi:serine/threonine protein kinase